MLNLVIYTYVDVPAVYAIQLIVNFLLTVATPTFLPALTNLYGDKSAMVLLSGGGGKKGKKSGSISTSKIDSTHFGEKVCMPIINYRVMVHNKDQPAFEHFSNSVFGTFNNSYYSKTRIIDKN